MRRRGEGVPLVRSRENHGRPGQARKQLCHPDADLLVSDLVDVVDEQHAPRRRRIPAGDEAFSDDGLGRAPGVGEILRTERALELFHALLEAGHPGAQHLRVPRVGNIVLKAFEGLRACPLDQRLEQCGELLEASLHGPEGGLPPLLAAVPRIEVFEVDADRGRVLCVNCEVLFEVLED